MQVGIDVKCMHTNFGGRGLSGFGDKISLWSIKVEKFNRSESAQKIHGLKGKFGCFLKVAISPKLEKLHPPKLVSMYVTSTPTCMIFLS